MRFPDINILSGRVLISGALVAFSCMLLFPVLVFLMAAYVFVVYVVNSFGGHF